ncbi:MAG: hypothetical protein WC959_08430 [Kiritimatiellales bacterium]
MAKIVFIGGWGHWPQVADELKNFSGAAPVYAGEELSGVLNHPSLAGIPAIVDAEFVTVEQKNQKKFQCIKNIGAHVRQMANEGLLFSDAGVPWAKPARIADMRNYTHFPSMNHELIELEKM